MYCMKIKRSKTGILNSQVGILLSCLVFRRWGTRTSMSDPTITSQGGWWSRQWGKVNRNPNLILVIITIALVVISVLQFGKAEKLGDDTTKLLVETKNLLAA